MAVYSNSFHPSVTGAVQFNGLEKMGVFWDKLIITGTPVTTPRVHWAVVSVSLSASLTYTARGTNTHARAHRDKSAGKGTRQPPLPVYLERDIFLQEWIKRDILLKNWGKFCFHPFKSCCCFLTGWNYFRLPNKRWTSFRCTFIHFVK